MRFFKITLILAVLIFSNTLMATESKFISVKEKKERFRSLIAPAVDNVYKELDAQFNEISKNLNNPKYNKRIQSLKTTYKVKSNEDLLMALKPHPRSIAISQAAMESAWATSRFFKKAKNIFGVWSFNKNEPRIAAGEKRGSKTIWLRKYSSIEDSVRDYYKTLGRSHAFKEFRKLRMKTDDPYKLVKKLDHYSEMDAKYGEELTSMIKYNKFYLYDKK
ncbi:glucosaminidase domain-containing protein [Sulfurimonas sp.]|uniref:glucosaminidase domain-containing protein n=1 Tax=Sulfurimonas sp. TaxID=2022749 RepID=UPI0025EAAD88|nr:glucosaminidase domain-containing protein [Sulfurimonas sp.]